MTRRTQSVLALILASAVLGACSHPTPYQPIEAATAEIVMHRGAKPQSNPRAFEADDVSRTLGPDIQMPSQN